MSRPKAWRATAPERLPGVHVIAVCPHCMGATSQTCCVCKERRVLHGMRALQMACANVWARVGCDCDTCADLPLRPGSEPCRA